MRITASAEKAPIGLQRQILGVCTCRQHASERFLYSRFQATARCLIAHRIQAAIQGTLALAPLLCRYAGRSPGCRLAPPLGD